MKVQFFADFIDQCSFSRAVRSAYKHAKHCCRLRSFCLTISFWRRFLRVRMVWWPISSINWKSFAQFEKFFKLSFLALTALFLWINSQLDFEKSQNHAKSLRHDVSVSYTWLSGLNDIFKNMQKLSMMRYWPYPNRERIDEEKGKKLLNFTMNSSNRNNILKKACDSKVAYLCFKDTI